MSSNGLNQKARSGTCRICQRRRNTERHVKAVGQVNHGFAVGHVWECIDTEECDQVANDRVKQRHPKSLIIQAEQRIGRFTEYRHFT